MRLFLFFAFVIFAQPALAQEPPSQMIGNWRGSYICLQGKTGLTLAIDKHQDNQFSGYFHFYPRTENTKAKEGCFAVNGHIDANKHIIVEAANWITRPDGYITVDLEGDLASSKSFSGNVNANVLAHCKTFTLQKQNSKATIPNICHSGLVSFADDIR